MIPNWLSLIDVLFVLVVLFMAWGASQRGFAAQVAHILTLVIFGVALFFGYPPLFKSVQNTFHNTENIYLMWAVMGAVLVLVIGVFFLFRMVLSKTLKSNISDQKDRAYGFLLGLFRGTLSALFGMILLVMLESSGKVYEAFTVKSKVGQLVCHELVPRIQPHLSQAELSKRFGEYRTKLVPRAEEPDYE